MSELKEMRGEASFAADKPTPRGERARGMSGGVRVRVLVPFMVAIAGLIAAFAVSLYVVKRAEITEESTKACRAVLGHFQAELDQEANMMGAALEAIAADGVLQSAFAARDTAALLKRAGPLFERMRERYRITHFYFHDPARVCVLRVHQPRRYGDRIDRFTAIRAQETGRLSYGIELGPLGTFTLRVVRPWHRDGQLIGYLELGEEIEHLTEHMRKSFGIEFYVAIHKRFLDRRTWEEGMKMLGREADWDRLDASVIVSRTMQETPEPLAAYLAKGKHHDEVAADVEVRMAGRDWRIAFWKLKDARGREVGDLVMLRDVTSEHAALRGMVLAGSLLALAVGGGLLVFFHVFLGRVDRTLSEHTAELTAANEGLKAEIRQREQTERELLKTRNHLRSIVEAIPEPFMVIDRDHRIVLANKVVRDIAGGVDPVAEGLRCHQALHHRDTPCDEADTPCPLREVVAARRPVRVTHTWRGTDGTPQVMEITASPVFDADGEVVQMIEACHDVTARQRAEEELKETVQELERFNRLAVGREERMIELKREVNELARKAGVAPPYDLAFAEAGKEDNWR